MLCVPIHTNQLFLIIASISVFVVRPGGDIKEYCGIDGVIVFCAIREKPMRSFLDDVFGYLANVDSTLENEVYFRLCTLIENQTIIMKCLI